MIKEGLLSKEYKKSLKPENAEEVVDYYIYRPIAFVFVKILAKTRITPNFITVMGIFWGLLAGFFLSRGTVEGFVYGAVIYQIANIFDCVDGQLARLKSMYSDFGRILDGLVDYINTSAVYIGSLIGLLKIPGLFNGIHHTFTVVVLASISTIFTSAVYDKLKSRYMNLLSGHEVVKEDLDKIRNKINSETSILQRSFFSIYLFYLKAQIYLTEMFSTRGKLTEKLIRDNQEEYRELYLERNSVLLRVWSIVGPSTHALYFLIFALIHHFPWYFLFVAGPLNIILAVLFVLQYITEKRIFNEIKGSI